MTHCFSFLLEWSEVKPLKSTNLFPANIQRIQIPVAPIMPLAYNPSEVLKNLEREAQALKLLHSKISDQLNRLQVLFNTS